MEFFYKSGGITLESEKKQIQFLKDALDIDGLKVEMAWEYEKSGFLAYAHELAEVRIYQMRVEWYTLGYIPEMVTDLTAEQLDFLSDLDLLIMPTSKLTQPLLEKIEPSTLVTYGETAQELATALWVSEPPVQKFKLKDSDLSHEKMSVIVLGE